MTDTYLLSEGEYRKRYPASNTLDMTKFYTCVAIEQETTCNDTLGDALYAELLTQAAGTPDAEYSKLLDNVQTLLVYCVSRALIEFKDNVTNSDEDVRTLNLEGKINYIKAKINRLIETTPELQAVASGDDTYDSDQYQDSTIHFWS